MNASCNAGRLEINRFGGFAMRSPVAFKNVSGSGRSFTMKVETVSAASNEMYLPC